VFNTLDIEILKKHFGNRFDSYPELMAHYERIGNIPSIKKWIETRPVAGLY